MVVVLLQVSSLSDSCCGCGCGCVSVVVGIGGIGVIFVFVCGSVFVLVWGEGVGFVCVVDVDLVGLVSVCNVRVRVFERDLVRGLSKEEKMSGVLVESLFDLHLQAVVE